MSLVDHPFHGPIHHLGYVVEDLEATVQRLVSELGAGPFFVLRDVSFEQVTSRGEALRSGSSCLSCMTSIGTAPHCPNALSW